jgi:hypothetical protein
VIAKGKKTDKQEKRRKAYAKPELAMHDNLKDITFECQAWQCSVVVPPPPEH